MPIDFIRQALRISVASKCTIFAVIRFVKFGNYQYMVAEYEITAFSPSNQFSPIGG